MSSRWGPWPTVPMPNSVGPSRPEWLQRYRRQRLLRYFLIGILGSLAGLLAGLFLGGCATTGTLAPRVGQEQATWIIWRETYGRTDRPPLVRWVTGEQLTCDDPNSGKRGIAMGGQCREGWTWSPLEVLVSYHGEATLSETVLAHELAHAAQFRMGIIDPRHTRGEWWDAGGLVDRAEQAIRAAGR